MHAYALRFPARPTLRTLPRAALLAATGLLAAGTAAAQAAAPSREGGSAPPRWEIGVFGLGVSQQAYPGSDTQLSRGLVLPYVIYRGRVLRAEQGGAGLRALKTDRMEVDVGFAGSFGSRADEVPARQGMPKLGTLVEFGPRLKINLTGPGETWMGGRWRVELPVRGVFDLSDGFANRGVSFEPELQFSRRSASGFNYRTTVSAIVGNRDLTDTFYGVAPAFATPTRPAFSAEAGLVGWRLGTSFSRPLTPDWTLFGFVRLDSVSGAANRASPLVRQTNGVTGGLGISWTWMRSSAAGVD
jgi:outer membrane scaffolding protein for murein synthesis (MipA/OmpV family)